MTSMARYDHIDFSPPQGVREACLRGVALHEQGITGDGIEPETVAWARRLARGENISPSKARKMARFFGRNQRFAAEPKDSPAWASWQLWGGHAGDAWSEKLVTQMDAADENAKMSETTNSAAANDTAQTMADDSAHAVPFESYPVHESAWDADAAVERMRKWAGVDAENPSADAWKKYAEGFAIVRGPRDNLTSYILPHHDVVDGRLVTVSAGVSAAIGALHGARGGGVDVPDAVRDAALKHLERHRDESQEKRTASDDSTDVPSRGEPIAIAFADGGQPSVGHSTWNQIARVGTFKGHPQGAIEFTPAVFAQIIANFRATMNGEVPGDYEHTSERLPPTVATDGVPAPFWVTDVQTRNGERELWAKFTWADPRAVQYVRTRQYKYVSPAVNFNARSRETGLPIGARLTSVALTNHPFLDGMQPIAASARDDESMREAIRAEVEAALSARFSPDVNSVHTPTTGAPTEKRNMENEGAAKAAEAKPDEFKGKYMAVLARAAKAMKMADYSPEMENAEDALIEQLERIAEQLEQHQERERQALASAAATMADRVIAAKLAPASAKDSLAKLCLSDRKTFDALYPEAGIAAAEGAKTMSDRTAVTRDGAAVLMSNLGAAGGTMHKTAADGGADVPEAHRLHARALEVVKQSGGKIDLFTARKQVETEAANAAR